MRKKFSFLLILGIVLKKESFTNYGDVKRLDKTQSITSMCLQKADKKTNVSRQGSYKSNCL